LKQIITSLEASTVLEIEAGGVRVEVGGRCSPYLSHLKIGYFPLRNQGRTVVFRNTRFSLGVFASPEDIPPCPCGCNLRVEHLVPRTLLDGLFSEASKYLGHGREKSLLIPVAFHLPQVSSWGEDGKPIYEIHREGEEE